MEETLEELDIKASLVMADDGSGIGAALVAVVAQAGGAVRAARR
jgi:hexokinase